MHKWMNEWMKEWMNKWMNAWKNEWMKNEWALAYTYDTLTHILKSLWLCYHKNTYVGERKRTYYSSEYGTGLINVHEDDMMLSMGLWFRICCAWRGIAANSESASADALHWFCLVVSLAHSLLYIHWRRPKAENIFWILFRYIYLAWAEGYF